MVGGKPRRAPGVGGRGERRGWAREGRLRVGRRYPAGSSWEAWPRARAVGWHQVGTRLAPGRHQAPSATTGARPPSRSLFPTCTVGCPREMTPGVGVVAAAAPGVTLVARPLRSLEPPFVQRGLPGERVSSCLRHEELGGGRNTLSSLLGPGPWCQDICLSLIKTASLWGHKFHWKLICDDKH